MTDLCQEVCFGPQFGAINGFRCMLVAAVGLNLALPLEQRKAEDQPGTGGYAEHDAGQPIRVELIETQQNRQNQNEAAIEQQHARDQQPGGFVALTPVMNSHDSDADGGD